MTRMEIIKIGLDIIDFKSPNFLNLKHDKKISEAINEPIFKCPECHRKLGFIDLEVWSTTLVEELLQDKCICSECYENEMGWDL